jgi:hypothetical protein
LSPWGLKQPDIKLAPPVFFSAARFIEIGALTESDDGRAARRMQPNAGAFFMFRPWA